MVEENLENDITPTDNPNDNSTQPAESEGKSPLDEAKEILAETKKAFEQISQERKLIEKATAESLVNGRSRAGQQIPPKIETPQEYAERVMNNKVEVKR